MDPLFVAPHGSQDHECKVSWEGAQDRVSDAVPEAKELLQVLVVAGVATEDRALDSSALQRREWHRPEARDGSEL